MAGKGAARHVGVVEGGGFEGLAQGRGRRRCDTRRKWHSNDPSVPQLWALRGAPAWRSVAAALLL